MIHKQQVVWVAWTGLEREVLVERLGAVVLGTDEQCTGAEGVGRFRRE
jgi:hypothetical protein